MSFKKRLLKRGLIPAAALFLSLSMLAGCGTTGGKKGDNTADITNGPPNTESVSPSTTSEPSSQKQESPDASTLNKTTVTLYFSDSDAMYVVPERREIEFRDEKDIPEETFKALMEGPRTEGLHPVIPKGTKLYSIKVEDGLAVVDLSKEFVDNSPGGTASEAMTLGGIVNTLTELEGIEKVQFLIEGEKREVYTHAVFDEPFERDESLIKK